MAAALFGSGCRTTQITTTRRQLRLPNQTTTIIEKVIEYDDGTAETINSKEVRTRYLNGADVPALPSKEEPKIYFIPPKDKKEETYTS